MSETIISKRCSKCKDTKPLSEFYKDLKAKDGHQPKCKSCNKKYSQTEKFKTTQKHYRKTEKGRITQRAAHKRYRQTEKGKARESLYRQSEAGKVAQKRHRTTKKGKATQKRYFIRHPERRKATSAVNQAIQNGQLPPVNSLKCCCGKQAEEYHHYLGYAPKHWLDVIPVCIKCHHNQEVRASNQE